MTGIPYALALTAGMLAAFNPCGFAMLPAYLTLFISGSPDRTTAEARRRGALSRALVATAAMTSGFTFVFGAFALLVSPLALSVERWLPWATVAIGIVLLALGAWLLAGRDLNIRLPKLQPTGRPADSARSMALYGISYAIASLSCTIGPFLALTTTAFRTGSLPGVVGVFLAYAAGMGTVVGALTLTVALSRQAALARIRRVMPYVSRTSGALLLLAGAYVAYYGWYEIRLVNGSTAEDPVISTATHWQGAVTRWLSDLGPTPVLWAITVLLAATWTARTLHRRRAGQRQRSSAGDLHQPNVPGSSSR
ncbi:MULTISPECIES: cytochrome c biogenesis CcdA family protein [unclassified Streptomyces]|uniref:cytochrome c biogenesis CcdA family protein n=1 Tax=unclassified Streptomyces TaxID=2593676 RepID=UPI00073C655F|nr:cytochrome c biogenesis CcdA family protein [Streptomyces sp. AVP053U2]ODA69117.1 Cytochrome C biogenesis protein transmembrane region [Streptomyces sp. AVP053U2]